MKKKHILPAVLSGLLWPGLGQIIKGDFLKGIIIFLLFPFGLFVVVFFSMLSSVELGIMLVVILVGIYLWNVFDALLATPRKSTTFINTP